MKIFSYLIIIFLGSFLILVSFNLLLFSKSFYRSEFRKLKVYDNFENPQIVNYESERLVNYLCCQQNLEGDFFSQRDKLHMADVKNLVKMTTVYFFMVTILIATFTFLLIEKKQLKSLLFGFRWGSMFTFIAISFLSTGITFEFIDFNKAFVGGHYVLFSNDLWQLPPESNLIKLFPAQFFADFANRLGSMILITSLLIFIITYFLEKKLVAKHR